MPGQKKGGKRKKRDRGQPTEKELVLKDEGQEYGQVIKSIGNGYLQVLCFQQNQTVERRAHIRGAMRRRVRMVVGDIVLISLRGFNDSTCDIIHKYNPNETKILRSRGEIPQSTERNDDDSEDEDAIIFTDNSDEDEKQTEKGVLCQNRNYDMPESDSDDDDNITKSTPYVWQKIDTSKITMEDLDDL